MAFEILQLRLQSRPVRAVLFDMDGLILDTEKLYCRFWQEAARSLGYPMTRQQALGMRALNHTAGQAKLIEYFGEGVDYGTMRNRRITLMDAFVEKEGVEAFPGIYPLLDYLQEKGIATAVASSSPMDRIEAYLTPLGLFHRFDAIITGRHPARWADSSPAGLSSSTRHSEGDFPSLAAAWRKMSGSGLPLGTS